MLKGGHTPILHKPFPENGREHSQGKPLLGGCFHPDTKTRQRLTRKAQLISLVKMLSKTSKLNPPTVYGNHMGRGPENARLVQHTKVNTRPPL